MSLLEEIVGSTRTRIEESRERVPEDALRSVNEDLPPARSLSAALSGRGISLIAEIKRASPSAGDIGAGLDASETARRLAEAGADALSVLTEPHHFKGALEDLRAASGAGLPVLRKDFVLDEYQILESRAGGADAVLLIVRCLGERTSDLLDAATAAGLEALVEVFDETDMEIALRTRAPIIGINSRDLETFEVDLSRFELRSLIPSNRIAIALSGISSREDMLRVEAAGMDAVLVGEGLMRAPDPARKVAELLGTSS
jgi:indole-3-glycerol phosphate synthase